MSKNCDTIKYKRGQVWMRKVSDNWGAPSSVQYNNRPCLIISNDYGNVSSSVVTIVKVTSVDKGSLNINVSFYNDKEELGTILCNQIETISKSELAYYMFTVSDDIMDKVEKALLEAQGIAYEKNIPNAINEIYKILNRLEVLKIDNSPTVTKDQEMILQTAEKLNQLYIDLGNYYEKSSEELKEQVNPYTQYLIRKELNINETATVDSSNIDEEIKISKETPKKKYTKWTKETMENFMNDKNRLSLTDCTEKWGFKNNKSCSQMFNVIKKKYNKLYGETI